MNALSSHNGASTFGSWPSYVVCRIDYNFYSIEMLPGDFGVVLGQAATEETVAAFRKELGLDKPSYMRYFDWIGGVAQGDLGTSFSGRAASGQIDQEKLQT